MAATKLLMPALRTRFAPAPTGHLHLGHVVNALFVWGLARRLGADVVLRVEDHDRQRSKAVFETSLLDDLDWLGFVPDDFPTAAFRAGPCLSRQSDRHSIYAAAAAALQTRGLVYGCTCTRREIVTSAPGNDRAVYAGTCRTRALPLDTAPSWRVRLDSGSEQFVDLLRGPVVQAPAACHGDPLIRDRHGNWTYGFAVVVDDLEQQIGLVVRGVDLLTATGEQIQLARLLGRNVPARFAHHGLVMKSPTQKLSKADGDSGVRDLRRAGWSPDQVIGLAAAQAGLAPSGRAIGARDAPALLAGLQLASG